MEWLRFVVAVTGVIVLFWAIFDDDKVWFRLVVITILFAIYLKL